MITGGRRKGFLPAGAGDRCLHRGFGVIEAGKSPEISEAFPVVIEVGGVESVPPARLQDDVTEVTVSIR